MSTRSTLSVANAEGTFTGIYIHNDGYPTNMGVQLVKLAQDARLNELTMVIGDNPFGLSFLSADDEDLDLPAYNDLPEEAAEEWRVRGSLSDGYIKNHQEWNYIIDANRKLHIYDDELTLVASVSLNRNSKISWDKIEDRQTATYLKRMTMKIAS